VNEICQQDRGKDWWLWSVEAQGKRAQEC